MATPTRWNASPAPYRAPLGPAPGAREAFASAARLGTAAVAAAFASRPM